VETTNALLLLPDGASPSPAPARVAATAGAHVELVRAPPRFDPLDDALTATAYGARHHGTDGGAAAAAAGGLAPPLTYPALLALTPASDAELRAELAARRVVRVPGGGVRALAPAYAAALVDAVVATAQAGGHPLAALPTAAVVADLVDDGYDRAVAEAGVAAVAALPIDPATLAPTPSPLPPVVAADHHTLRVHAARKLLDAQPVWEAAAWAEAWAEALPHGVAPDPAALAGEAVVDAPPAAHPAAPPPPPTVTKLRAADLPREPAARFAALFAARPRWERSEIGPYLPPPPPGSTVEAALLAHARASQAGAGAPVHLSAR
jgi:hypothetical protein